MYKKLMLLVLIACVGFAFCGCSRRVDNVIKVGAILPLTGDLASYGVDTKRALELAAEEWNQKGGVAGKKIQIIFEDSKGNSSLAAIAMNKLTAVDNVIGVLGPITSPEVLSVAPIANTSQKPLISPSSTSINITKAGPYIFRTINADNIETLFFSRFILKNLKSPKIGILADRAAGTISYAESFEKYYTQNGGEIVGEVIFQENLKDFRSEIIKILSHKNIQAIYVSGVSMEIGLITKQVREFNKTIQIYSYQSAEDRRVVDLAGYTVDGMVYSSTTLPEKYLGKSREIFVEAFRQKNNQKPGVFAAEIYDGFNILINSYRNSIENKGEFIEYLKSTKNYAGASGTISFDENGDVHKAVAIYRYDGITPVCMYVVEDGSFIPVH